MAWFVDAMASSPSGLAAGIGTLVHAVMEQVSTEPEADLSVEHIWQGVEQRWGELQFESPWLEEKERRRTRRLAEGLSEYLRDFDREGGVLLGSEGEFQLALGQALVSGKIDRVERTPDGTIVIVDLKTGKTVPSAAKMAEHAQLGATNSPSSTARSPSRRMRDSPRAEPSCSSWAPASAARTSARSRRSDWTRTVSSD